MKTKYILLVLFVLFVGGVGIVMFQSGAIGDGDTAQVSDSTLIATLYKSPSCGCCGVYASYIQREGYETRTQNVADMTAIKENLEVPKELYSCHTMEISGYVVEGHIPEAAIQKLLTEKPNIKGIGMPGMPAGSPGMPGPKTNDFVVYEIMHDGTVGEVFMVI